MPVHLCVSAHMHAYRCMCVHVCMCMCRHVCVHRSAYKHVYMHNYVHVNYVCTHACRCVYICVCAHVYVCMWGVHMHTCVPVSAQEGNGLWCSAAELQYQLPDRASFICFLIIFFKDFYLFIHEIEREREREAETQAEGETGSMQGARCGT